MDCHLWLVPGPALTDHRQRAGRPRHSIDSYIIMYVWRRLSAAPPWHLALAPRAGGAEREAARQAQAALRGMVARVPPACLAPPRLLRRAMGVTLDHLGNYCTCALPILTCLNSSSFIGNESNVSNTSSNS